MTDYNDGKWHAWNGGDCPVHPKSVVDMVWPYLHSDGAARSTRTADAFDWQVGVETHAPFIFRVVTPHASTKDETHRKRATFWLANGQFFQSAREAKTAHPGANPTKVKECK